MHWNRHYVVGTTGLGYEPDETGFEFRQENKIFFSSRNVQIAYWDDLISCWMGIGIPSLGVKRTNREFNRSNPSGAEVKNEWS